MRAPAMVLGYGLGSTLISNNYKMPVVRKFDNDSTTLYFINDCYCYTLFTWASLQGLPYRLHGLAPRVLFRGASQSVADEGDGLCHACPLPVQRFQCAERRVLQIRS